MSQQLAIPEGASVFDAQRVLSDDDTQWEWVDVPAWGGGCFVRNLSSAERDQFEIDIAKMQKKKGSAAGLFRATIVQRCACKPDKTPLFGPQQMALLARKNAAAVDAISEVALRLSGMTESDLEAVAKKLRSRPQRRLWLRLCAHFRILDVDEAIAKIGPKKFLEWMAYDRYFEPIGNEAEAMAKLMAMLVQVNGNDADWQDFMPNAYYLKRATARRRVRAAERGGIRGNDR